MEKIISSIDNIGYSAFNQLFPLEEKFVVIFLLSGIAISLLFMIFHNSNIVKTILTVADGLIQAVGGLYVAILLISAYSENSISKVLNLFLNSKYIFVLVFIDVVFIILARKYIK